LSALRRFFKDAVIYGIAAVLPRVINFLLVRVHTDALPTKAYAENTNFYIWIALLLVVLTFGMETAFFRFYKGEKEKGAVISTAFLSVGSAVLLFVLVSLFTFDSLVQAFDFTANPIQLRLLIFILVLDTLSVIPFAYLRAVNRPVRYTFIKLVNVGIIVVLNLFFLKFLPEWTGQGKNIPEWLWNLYQSTDLVNFIFIANVAGSAVSFAMLLPYLRRFSWRFDKALFRKMISYGWPIAIAGMAYVINENLDKILIGQMIDKETMGIYAACYKLAIFMNLYIMAFRLGAEPFFFNHSDQKDAKKTYALILNYFIIVGAVVFVGIVVFIDFLKALFINREYWDAIAIVPVILLANLFLGVYHNLSVWYKLTDRTRYAMVFSLWGALVTIVVNLVFIPIIGYMASAWATLCAYGSMMFISWMLGRKHYRVPYDLVKSGTYLLAAIVIAFASFTWFRENYLVSVSMLAGFGLLVVWKEKHVIQSLVKQSKT
jgi:O-antigen/teichoic acid export membrane protein